MRIVFLIVLLLGGVFVIPLVKESASGPCDALEKLARRVALERGVSPTILQGLSLGTLAEVTARDRYPVLPPGIACTALYWNAVIDSGRLQKDFVGKSK